MRQIVPEKRRFARSGYLPPRTSRLEIDNDTAGIQFRAVHHRATSERTILVGMRCLARLWATAYGYFELYNAAAAASAIPGHVATVDFFVQASLNSARGLLHWAIRTALLHEV